MARKDRYQTRLDSDHAERVDQYRDDHDLTQAEAVRRLILTGLDAEEGQATVPADEIRDDLDRLRDELADDQDDGDDDGRQVTVYGQMGGKRLGSLAIAAGSLGTVLFSTTSTGTVTVGAALTSLLLGVVGVLGVGLILYGLWPVLTATNGGKPGVSRPDDAD